MYKNKQNHNSYYTSVYLDTAHINIEFYGLCLQFTGVVFYLFIFSFYYFLVLYFNVEYYIIRHCIRFYLTK